MKSFGSNGTVTYICLDLGTSEKKPKEVVQFLDAGDRAFDPENLPQFDCKKCIQNIIKTNLDMNLGLVIDDKNSYSDERASGAIYS